LAVIVIKSGAAASVIYCLNVISFSFTSIDLRQFIFSLIDQQLEQAREQKSHDSSKPPSSIEAVKLSTKASAVTTTGVVGPGERVPASWRWEKQELERQLKEHKKKLDDVYSEMKRSQQKWKAAGEDIERVSHPPSPTSASPH